MTDIMYQLMCGSLLRSHTLEERDEMYAKTASFLDGELTTDEYMTWMYDSNWTFIGKTSALEKFGIVVDHEKEMGE